MVLLCSSFRAGVDVWCLCYYYIVYYILYYYILYYYIYYILLLYLILLYIYYILYYTILFFLLLFFLSNPPPHSSPIFQSSSFPSSVPLPYSLLLFFNSQSFFLLFYSLLLPLLSFLPSKYSHPNLSPLPNLYSRLIQE